MALVFFHFADLPRLKKRGPIEAASQPLSLAQLGFLPRLKKRGPIEAHSTGLNRSINRSFRALKSAAPLKQGLLDSRRVIRHPSAP